MPSRKKKALAGHCSLGPERLLRWKARERKQAFL